MRHMIDGQVGIKIITSITGGKDSFTSVVDNMPQPRWKGQFCKKVSLTNFPILLYKLSVLQKEKVNHKAVLKAKLREDLD